MLFALKFFRVLLFDKCPVVLLTGALVRGAPLHAWTLRVS